MTQAELRRILGVARQTVWKMVTQLVEAGLLFKWRTEDKFVLVRLTEDGLERIRAAYGVAFTERDAEPPADDEPRKQRRYRKGEAVTPDGKPIHPQLRPFRRTLATATTVGREVARVFTTYAWEWAGRGRRHRRSRQLQLLDHMMSEAREIAQALGDTSRQIYPLDIGEDD